MPAVTEPKAAPAAGVASLKSEDDRGTQSRPTSAASAASAASSELGKVRIVAEMYHGKLNITPIGNRLLVG